VQSQTYLTDKEGVRKPAIKK